MAFFPAFKKKTDIVVAKTFHSPRVPELVERFENIKNIADVADKLLMLAKFEREANDLWYQERSFKNEKFGEGQYMLTLFGVAAAVGGLGFVVASGGTAALFFIPGFVGGIVSSETMSRKALRSYDDQYKDLDVLGQMTHEAGKIRSHILENVDTKVIARSPRGVDAFTRFPALKEKFMLALTVDKVLAADREQQALPNLDKAVKTPAAKPGADL